MIGKLRGVSHVGKFKFLTIAKRVPKPLHQGNRKKAHFVNLNINKNSAILEFFFLNYEKFLEI